jgi:uncharacterized protein with NRDE domain
MHLVPNHHQQHIHQNDRILASNRDEYLNRATAPTSFHSFNVEGIEKEAVLSGVDLQAGGSWLGVNKHGEVAML